MYRILELVGLSYIEEELPFYIDRSCRKFESSLVVKREIHASHGINCAKFGHFAVETTAYAKLIQNA
jgi:hypothetical protein